MSITAKFPIAVALITIALGSVAYASDASETYGGDAGGRAPAASIAPGNWDTLHVARGKHRGMDAYAKEGGALSFPSTSYKSMLSPGSLDYQPEFNH